MDSKTILQALDLFGLVVFSISGALAAGKKHMDIFGVLVLSFVTALGGGTLRDLLLDDGPVFWVTDVNNVMVVALTSVAMFFVIQRYAFTGRWLLVSDALGLAVFTLMGAQKTLSLHTSGGIAVIMGITTGVAGGMIRDILSAEVPLILQKEIYATAAFCGAGVYVVSVGLGVSPSLGTLLSILTTLLIRLAAIRWSLSLPVPAYKGEKS